MNQPSAPSSQHLNNALLSQAALLSPKRSSEKLNFPFSDVGFAIGRKSSSITASHWDALFRAVEERLTLTVSQPFVHLPESQINTAAVRIRAAVLECVEAMELLRQELVMEGQSRLPAGEVNGLPAHGLAAESDASGSMAFEPPDAAEKIAGLPSDRDFVAMLLAYRSTGGMTRSSEMATLMENSPSGPSLSLPTLLASGHIFSFDWNDTSWIPMFQFHPVNFAVKQGVAQVMTELGAVFDNWAVASWFAESNCWLNDARPVDLMDSDLSAVLQAARADRFAVTG